MQTPLDRVLASLGVVSASPGRGHLASLALYLYKFMPFKFRNRVLLISVLRVLARLMLFLYLYKILFLMVQFLSSGVLVSLARVHPLVLL